jgi:glyceraldehyde-3-phosphate dehydrogenase (NAD(P))
MSRKIIHIVGTGTIGEPLIGILTTRKDNLGIEEISFQPDIEALENKALLKGLVTRGAKICVLEEHQDAFMSSGFRIEATAKEAIDKAAVIIDCTPRGQEIVNKTKIYSQYLWQKKAFIAQSNHEEFGKPYAHGINNHQLDPGENQFIRIVSCNANNIATLVNTFLHDSEGQDNFESGRFVCIRRATDISQPSGFIPAPQVGSHKVNRFGTYQAADAAAIFATIGKDLDLFSSTMKVNTQYLHVVHFNLRLKHKVSLPKVLNHLEASPLIAVTNKTLTSLVVAFARDLGYLGRVLNPTVVSIPTLTVNNSNEIIGFCFSPQDSNSMLNSISAALWYLFPHSYEDKLQHLKDLIFSEI